MMASPSFFVEETPWSSPSFSSIPSEVMAFLQVDLTAIQHNYRLLQKQMQKGRCGAVLKANAYSMGLAPVARALVSLGCEDFFVAHGEEGLALRKILSLEKKEKRARIYVFSGVLPGSESLFQEASLIPVLNDRGHLERWRSFSRQKNLALPAMIYLDTGMARNGFGKEDVALLAHDLGWIQDISFQGYLSHLACAEDPSHEMNGRQLTRLREFLGQLPQGPVSLVNSAGILLGPEYHYDIARPGQALYGVQPSSSFSLPLQRVVSFYGRIVQIQSVPGNTAVGYGSTYVTPGPSRLATLAVGYADGYKRFLGQVAWVYYAGQKLRVLGRVSMDYMTVDISSIPEDHIAVGNFMELLGPHVSLEDLATMGQTIPHEILVGWGPRCHRFYKEI